MISLSLWYCDALWYVASPTVPESSYEVVLVVNTIIPEHNCCSRTPSSSGRDLSSSSFAASGHWCVPKLLGPVLDRGYNSPRQPAFTSTVLISRGVFVILRGMFAFRLAEMITFSFLTHDAQSHLSSEPLSLLCALALFPDFLFPFVDCSNCLPSPLPAFLEIRSC